MRTYNLVTHLVLPQYPMSIRMLEGYLIESYILTDHKTLVAVVDYEASTQSGAPGRFGLPSRLNPHGGFTDAFAGPSYVDRYYVDGKLYIVHDGTAFSGRYADMLLLIKGKYSQISETGFEFIRNGANLPYRMLGSDGSLTTDRRLLACSKDRDERCTLRKVMEEELQAEIPEDAELLDKMSDDCFAHSVVDVIRKYSPGFQDDLQKYSPKAISLVEVL